MSMIPLNTDAAVSVLSQEVLADLGRVIEDRAIRKVFSLAVAEMPKVPTGTSRPYVSTDAVIAVLRRAFQDPQ